MIAPHSVWYSPPKLM